MLKMLKIQIFLGAAPLDPRPSYRAYCALKTTQLLINGTMFDPPGPKPPSYAEIFRENIHRPPP